MTAVPPEAVSAAPARGAVAAGDAALTAPVVVGPVAVTSLGGIPVIALNGPIHHFSGNRLKKMIFQALTEAGLTIDIPD